MSQPPRVIVGDRVLAPGGLYPIREALRHHLMNVLRLRRGAEVVVVDRDGRSFRARIGGARGARVLEVVGPEPDARAVRETIRIRLLLALLKSDRTEWAIQKATEAGVSEVRVVVCERSIPRPAPSEVGRRLSRMQRVAAEAARQCGRVSIPEVSWHPDLVEALDAVGKEDRANQRRFILDESPDVRPLASCISGGALDEICLAIGPEGSFSPTEREALVRARFEPAGLGPRVLRAETAAVVAVTVVQVILGDLSGRSVSEGK